MPRIFQQLTRLFASPVGVWILVGLVLAGALGLRVWMAADNGFPTVDGVFYLEQSRELVHQHHLSYSCFPPGWPLLTALPLALQDQNDPMAMLRAAQMANVVFGSLFCLLTFLALRPLLGCWLALLAMALLAILPGSAVLARGDLSEMSYACGLLAGWLMLQKDRRFLAGLLFGYTYLIRPEALLAAAGLGLWLLWRHRRLPWTYALGVLIPVLPYLAFIRVTTGTWDLSSKSVAVQLSLEAYPGWRYPGLVWKNLTLLVPLLWRMIGLPLVLLGLWGLVRRPGRWLWMLAPLLPVPFIINPMAERFWVPYLPFILLAAGLGGRALWELGSASRRRLLAVGLLLVALAGQGLAMRDDVSWYRAKSESFHGLKQAGVWLRERVEPDTVIAAYKPYTSYWAGCRFIKYPDLLDAMSLVTWAQNNGAEYMVVNVHVVHYLRHGLDHLLIFPTPTYLQDKVELVQLFKFDDTQHTTAIYRLKN